MWENIKKLNNLIPDKLRLGIFQLIVLMFFLMLFELFILQNLFIIINYFSSPDLELSNSLIDYLKQITKIENIEITLLSIFLALFIFKNILSILVSKFESRLITGIRADLSQYFFEGYINMPVIFRLKSNTADLAKNITEEVDHISATVHSLSILTLEILILIGISVYLLFIDFQISIIALLSFLLFGFAMNALNRKKIIKIGKKRISNIEKRLKVVLEGLTSYKEIKIFGLVNKTLESFKSYNNNLKKIFFTVNFRNSLPKPIFELFIVVLIFCFFLITRTSKSEISSILPILGVFLAAAYRIIPSLSRIFTNLQRFQYNSQSIPKMSYDKQLFKFNDSINTKNLKKIHFEKNIELKDVSFAYNNSETQTDYVLKNINLMIRKGEKIGIIGESGSGKSTLLNIILGLFPIKSGKISIDGQSLKSLNSSWHENVSCVPQDIFIYNESLIKNITFQNEYTENTKSKLSKIFQALNLDDFVNSLENGLETQLGDSGVRLSGGQKQRIGIARAMYLDSKILILDEATSSLDFYNEKKIIESFNILNKEQTVIFVSHNNKIFNNFDKVYEIRDKTLIERK